ncbi:MAG: molybdenum cofactor biosynthesis protein MoaE [Planctomycetaceae bacterium]|nr:molybdenum cofactor biosynthesis protein MoaE [Planctomycetaceae bacterium]
MNENQQPNGPKAWIQISPDPIPVEEILQRVRDLRCGAVVLFLGTVRELTDGRRTVSLSYESYEQMAELEIRKLIREAQASWPLRHVAIQHRIGPLQLGDDAVAVAVSSPHRKEAFAAAEFLMDRIKQTVPIWKQEHWSDGQSEWIHPGAE